MSGPVDYELRLAADLRWAFEDAGDFLRGQGTVHQALRRVTERLDRLGIAYAVAGGLALFRHGYRRFTEDVDLLVTEEGLRRLNGGKRHLRDTETGVAIEFLVTGHYPGDGRPQPVAFPDPGSSATVVDGIAYLNLDRLIELKLAAGLSAPHRLRDFADALELIAALDLPAEFAERLDELVRAKYHELHAAASGR